MLKKPGSISMPMNYTEIFKYWNKNVCNGENPEFPFKMWKGKRVLEIGCGNGNDALKFVEGGAVYTGIDLTDNAIISTKLKIGNRGKVLKMNAELLDFPTEYFDLVYSFGVIHHTINPQNVINEAHRVLKKDGFICVMLYNKPSWRYNIEIMFLRKILWWLEDDKYILQKILNPYPTKEQWISMNTDTLGCPLARVYSKKEALKLLDKFNITKTWTENWGWFRMLLGKKNDI